jgi:hypothetical protein
VVQMTLRLELGKVQRPWHLLSKESRKNATKITH